ncbi:MULTISPECIES: TRAP transporter small permease [unclassified Halomonas]|uniref:TRAP transporter small permease n=1 Tax=unclassified Halomonas TaxID=2609666 RepID=UPI001C937895|nr:MULTISPECIES: TRAP transporter small permease [unclassified Halomonas]MBY5927324.1 TRAP transporter small permease [Halomonas sp. DP4Y7-2]MBY5986154.1 TRAP transporter small permease [Halomonas sp. DP5Y7-2]MBY6234365.1 TRAP transporter small permease [Halomonas sp. DP4Y7-1]
MTTNSTLAKALGAFWWLLTAVVVGAFGLMLLVMGIQVISRYALGVAVPWTDEVSRYLFLAEIFLGSVLALRYQEHIRITIVTDLLSARAKRVAAMLADIVSILVLAMIMGGAFNMMERTAGVFASTFDMSFSYLYLMQLIAAGLMVLLLVEDFIERLTTPDPRDGDKE